MARVTIDLPGDSALAEKTLGLRPPLGLRPREAVGMRELIIDRRAEILLAMLRYSQANKHIPIDWILELSELNAPK